MGQHKYYRPFRNCKNFNQSIKHNVKDNLRVVVKREQIIVMELETWFTIHTKSVKLAFKISTVLLDLVSMPCL